MADVPGVSKYGARKNPYRLPCKICGAIFAAKRCTATYCSARCRQRAYRINVGHFVTGVVDRVISSIW